ncbi:MAG: restriction endonuclease subunit S [Oscillospiraceae bacterium]|nr:restriction endonuclease subunit S [Oscillospiraceae bacterium]
MQDNARKPAIRFAGFNDAWEQRKFGDLAIRSANMSAENGLPRVEYEDIISGTGQLNKDIFSKESSKTGIVFHKGDVLYGKLRPYLQNWLLPQFNGLAVGDFWVLQPQNMDSSFLYRLIQSRQFDEVANQSTGTKMPRADWKLVSKSDFFVPPSIDEQAAIGNYFEQLDHLIALHQRKYAKLVNIKKSMLEKMFPQNGSNVPEIRFAGFTDAWEQRKFGDLAIRSANMSAENGLPRVEYEDIISGTGQLNKDIFSKESSKTGIVFHKGDVLYGKLRPYLQNWLLPQFNGLAVGDFWVLQPQNMDSSFLYRLIQSRQFDEVANQSTGTKMPRADWKLVSKSDFFVPPSIDEQAAIGNYFEQLDHLIALHQRKLERLQNIKKACLEKMFV